MKLGRSTSCIHHPHLVQLHHHTARAGVKIRFNDSILMPQQPKGTNNMPSFFHLCWQGFMIVEFSIHTRSHNLLLCIFIFKYYYLDLTLNWAHEIRFISHVAHHPLRAADKCQFQCRKRANARFLEFSNNSTSERLPIVSTSMRMRNNSGYEIDVYTMLTHNAHAARTHFGLNSTEMGCDWRKSKLSELRCQV